MGISHPPTDGILIQTVDVMLLQGFLVYMFCGHLYFCSQEFSGYILLPVRNRYVRTAEVSGECEALAINIYLGSSLAVLAADSPCG